MFKKTALAVFLASCFSPFAAAQARFDAASLPRIPALASAPKISALPAPPIAVIALPAQIPLALAPPGPRAASALAARNQKTEPAASARLDALFEGRSGKVSILDLHPTQMAVGNREVEYKTRAFQDMTRKEAKKYLKEHPAAVVLGPQKRLYIIDRHHTAKAAWLAGIPRIDARLKADFSHLSKKQFWKKMEEKKWVYLYDRFGKGPRKPSALPKTVRDLKDDPYRSLAWKVREEGGYDKVEKPFMEFLWANFFRENLKTPITRFKKAVKNALKLAKSPLAKGLPGYRH